MLINSEAVGGLGSRADDVLVLGDCDAGVRKLAGMLGWSEELEELWQKTQPEKSEDEAEISLKSKDQVLEEEVERLAAEVDRSLTMSKDYDDRVRSQLTEDDRMRDQSKNGNGAIGAQGRSGVTEAAPDSQRKSLKSEDICSPISHPEVEHERSYCSHPA